MYRVSQGMQEARRPRAMVHEGSPAYLKATQRRGCGHRTKPITQVSFGRLKSFSLIFGFGAGSAVEWSADCSRAGGGGVEAGVAVVDRLPFDLPNLSLIGARWPEVSRFAAVICPGACHFGGIGFVLIFSVRRKRRWP